MKKWLVILLTLTLLCIAALMGLAEETVFFPVEETEMIFTPVEEVFALEQEEEPLHIADLQTSPFVIRDSVLIAYNGEDPDVTVLEGVTAIGEDAFAGNASLRTVTLPESIIEICAGAFTDCPTLEKVTALGVKKVGARAFFGCPALRETYFAEGAEIAADAFTLSEPSISIPVIISNPTNQTVAAGGTVTFAAKVNGATAYRWQYNAGSGWKDLYNGTVYSGVTTTRLTFTAVASLTRIQYRLRATSGGCTVYSNGATFTMKQATVSKPMITSHPSNQTVAAGSTVTFTAKANSATSYRWQYNAGSGWKDLYDGTVYSGVTTTRLTFTAVASLNRIQYRLAAKNNGGMAYSNGATFTLKQTTVSRPTITSHPSNQTVAAGSTVTFTAKANGAASYRWQYNAGSGWKDLYNGSVYSGATTTRLTFTAVASLSGIQYRLSAKNSSGTAYSKAASFMLKKSSAPVVTKHPESVAISSGTVTLTAAFSGATSYRWQYRSSSSGTWKDLSNNSVYSGVKTTKLKFSSKQSLSGYEYRCKGTNAYGSTYTIAAVFTYMQTRVSIMQNSIVIKNGATKKLTLTANTAVTWSSSNKSVATVNASGVVTGVYPGTAVITAKANNGSGVKASCSVKVQANYRALLISESTFENESIFRHQIARDDWRDILSHVHGPDGGSYVIDWGNNNVTTDGIKSLIQKDFGSALDGDVSLFFIATHGNSKNETNWSAGTLSTYKGSMSLVMLARELAKVKGKVIVIIEACGSGAATHAFNGSNGTNEDTDFAREVIAAFAEEDPMLVVKEFNEICTDDTISVPEPATNEFLTSKFVILTACGYKEYSYGTEALGFSSLDMTKHCKNAIGTSGSFPADKKYGNGDGILTMKELYAYVNDKLSRRLLFKQHPTIYPANGSYKLFIR